MRTVYLDGQFVPESEAKLSIYDLSVMQACAAFEMTRSFHGEHFKLWDHLERLQKSCELLGIPMPMAPFHIEQKCRQVADLNDHGPGEEHRLLIVVSPGCAPMYAELAGVIDHPFVYIADFPLRYTLRGFSRYFTEGVHAVTSDIRQIPDACLPSQAKHRSRLHFHLAQQQAPPGTWPILMDSAESYTEAPGANLCYVKGGQVYAIQDDCLQGISLATIKELTPTYGGSLDPLTVDLVDELWLTGTPFCLLPVVSLDGRPIGDGTIGPVYKATLAKWNALVGLDIAQQIIDWDQPRIWTPDVERTRATHG